jgi:hypothetical protein
MAGMTFVGHDDPSAPGSQESLVGSWIWVESTGGFAGMTRTPASTGETLTLAFTSGTDTLTLADPCCDGFAYRFVSNR